MIYMDASALVTLTIDREHSDELRRFLSKYPGIPMGSSTIGFVETVRTADKVGTFPTLMTDLIGSCTEIVLTDEVRDCAAQLPQRVRTLDALHIASAMSIGEFLTTLVSYDTRMLEVAKSQGLPVAAPGFDWE